MKNEPPVLLPTIDASDLVVPAPGDGIGYWAGGPYALTRDGAVYLAYRLRAPIGRGRGYANVVARSTDGVSFETVATITSEQFGADSLERPALAVTGDGRWRLYVSVATPGTKHWRIDVLEADEVAGLAAVTPVTVLPGDDGWAVKDPVITRDAGGWHLWASRHPLDDPEQTDRMVTDHATSPDGLDWTWQGTALAGTPGSWDSRGARFAWVLPTGDGRLLAYYDGRATAEQNYEEITGIAVGDGPDSFTALGDGPAIVSPHGAGGFRYLSVVTMPDGAERMYYELCRPDGAHELRTEVVGPAPAQRSGDPVAA